MTETRKKEIREAAMRILTDIHTYDASSIHATLVGILQNVLELALKEESLANQEPESKESFKKYLESSVKKGEWTYIRQIDSRDRKIVTLLRDGYPQFDSLNSFTDAELQSIASKLNAPALNSEESQEDKWISVEDELPNCSAEEYITQRGRHFISFSETKGYEINWMCGDPAVWQMYNQTVTHWQPLPSPPSLSRKAPSVSKEG